MSQLKTLEVKLMEKLTLAETKREEEKFGKGVGRRQGLILD